MGYKLCLLVLTTAFFYGCSAKLTRHELLKVTKYYSKTGQVPRFNNVAGMPSQQPRDTISVKRGDSLSVYAMAYGANAMGGNWTSRYLTYQGNDSVWINSDWIASAFELECQDNLGIVTVPKSESDDAWGRATVYVNKHTDMRIQVASDNIIDTYNPTKTTDRGYTITRRTSGDKAIIEIEVKGYAGVYDRCDAYRYIKYGK